MLNKNDPLIGAVQEIMKRNHAEREAAKLVNEKFGVTDRKALPHEKQSAWDAAYKTVLNEGVEALDEKIEMTQSQMANLDGKKEFTGADLRHLRAGTHRKLAAAGELEEAQINIDAAVAARKMSKMADKAKTPEEREELLAKMKKYKSQVRMQEERMNIDAAVAARKVAKMAMKAKSPEEREELERKSKMYKSQVRMKEDMTSPSSYNIKGPDYAKPGTTPDYAKPTTQTVNRGAKTSLPAGTLAKTMKEGAKVERMVSHIESSEMKAGMSPKKAKNIAWATVNNRGMLNNKNKKVNEGFSSRHNSSVNASAKKQVVTEITRGVPGTPAGFAASSTSNSMMAAQARMKAAEAAQARLAAQRERATSTTDKAPRPQPNMALQRQQSGDIAPRQQPNMALQRQQSGNVAPRPQPGSVALQRQQSGDVAPRQQPGSVALQRQQSGDVAPRPQASAPNVVPKPTARPATAAAKPSPVAATQKKVAPIAKASTQGGLRTQRDANLMARAKAGGGQKLSQTFKSGKDRLAYLRARARASK